MRIFKGVDTAAQLEVCQQKVGNVLSCFSPVERNSPKEILHSFNQPLFSLKDRISKEL